MHKTLGQMEEAVGQAQHAQNVAIWVLGKVAEALFERALLVFSIMASVTFKGLKLLD